MKFSDHKLILSFAALLLLTGLALAAIAPDRGVDDPNYVNTTEYGFWRIDPE